MSFWELLLIAIGLSMDAFAVAACAGLTMSGVTAKRILGVGLYFGFFQGLMPLAGWLLATWFADKIIAFDHWIAFVLLAFIGGRMIIGSFKHEELASEFSLKPAKMLPLAIATSIDALAIGVSLAFLRVSIVSAALLIGVVTFLLSMLGVKIGSIFGTKLKSKAELAGGAVLVIIGLKILLEHMGVFSL